MYIAQTTHTHTHTHMELLYSNYVTLAAAAKVSPELLVVS